MKRLASTMFVLAASAALVACGGSSSTGNQADAQSKQLVRTVKAGTVAGDYQNAVESLYVAYFGRPADPSGLANFETALLNAGAPTDVPGLSTAYTSNATVKTLIDSFGTSKESLNLYGSGTPVDFVNAIFQNVFGRAPAGTFWSDAVKSGSVSKGNAALSIMAGAFGNTTSQGKTDAQLVDNRLTVAAYFTVQVSARNATASYTGSAPAASARNMLAQVLSTTDTTAFESTVATTISGLSSLVGQCTAANMTVANYNAITLGMSLAQVNSAMGCQYDSTLTQRSQDYVAYAWQNPGTTQLISVFFDASGTTVTGLEGSSSFKNSSGLTGTGSGGSSAACTASNFTTANYNAIALGMTLAQVNNTIGCQYDNALTQRSQDYVAYAWNNPGSTAIITVFFDAGGNIVTGLEGSSSFKNSSGF